MSEFKLNALRQKQALPLEAKIRLTETRIIEWVEKNELDPIISFSGGKDSTVLLHICRSLYPNIKAVFANTGLEYPEIVEFVKGFDNVEIVKPKMSFYQVLKEKGYPMITKTQAQYVRQVKYGGTEKLRKLRLEGIINKTNGRAYYCIAPKWLNKGVLDTPFKISDECCNELKKKPLAPYDKKYAVILGEMAVESNTRARNYIIHGCNNFDSKKPRSKPLSVWTEQNILEYIFTKKLPIASVYGDVIKQENKFCTTGCSRTGCLFCMFGVHLEKGENRFQRLHKTHPQLWDYAINKLGLHEPLEWLGVDYK
jgi:3'-phosphoadenosine 5'-phosphosulfate sulfotransferase (PAPS reductase)/FAD synthetase